MNKLQQITPQTQPPPPSYAEKSFLHTIGAAVVVPFWQSVAISVAVCFVAFILFFRFGANLFDAFINALTVMALTFLVSLLFLLRHWFFLTVERTFDIDIPGVGEENLKSETVIKVNKITPERHFQQLRYVFPVSEEQILLFCRKVLSGDKRISRRKWTPKENGFSDDEWRGFWDKLTQYKLVEPKGGRYVFNEDGQDWAEGLIEAHSPTPDEKPDEN